MWFQVVGTNGIQGVKFVWEGVRGLRLNLQCQKEVLEGAAAVVALIHKLYKYCIVLEVKEEELEELSDSIRT